MDKGNPEQAATLEEQVKSVVKQMVVNKETGEVAFPQGLELSEDVKYAAKLEHRRLSTQSAYTKGQQRLKALEAERALLQEKVGSLSIKETQELEDLKYSDPDAYYEKRKALESQYQEELNQQLTDVSSKAAQEAELARRQEVLVEFNKSHPDFQLTDEIIAHDVPPRLTKQLETGAVSFEDYLSNVYEYLNKPKKIGDGNKTLNQPDLGKLGGRDIPNKSATAVDIVESYKKEIF